MDRHYPNPKFGAPSPPITLEKVVGGSQHPRLSSLPSWPQLCHPSQTLRAYSPSGFLLPSSSPWSSCFPFLAPASWAGIPEPLRAPVNQCQDIPTASISFSKSPDSSPRMLASIGFPVVFRYSSNTESDRETRYPSAQITQRRSRNF